ncbi:MAG TPA: hypothetical protein VGM93_11285, partial [Acidimicrobiales bacterium]
MGLLIARHRPWRRSSSSPAGPQASANAIESTLPAEPRTPVALGSRFVDLCADLAAALGPAYEVRVGPVDDAELAVVEAGRPASIAFLRAGHPDLGLVAVTWDLDGHDPLTAVAHL